MATSVDQSDYIKTALRLPRELHARLLVSSQESGASLNTEIVRLLQQALDHPTTEIGERSLDAIEARMRRVIKNK